MQTYETELVELKFVQLVINTAYCPRAAYKYK